MNLSVKSVTQTKQKIKVNLREHQDDTLELVITTGDTISNRLPDYEAPFATYELIVSPGDEIEIVPKSAVLYIQVSNISMSKNYNCNFGLAAGNTGKNSTKIRLLPLRY